MFNSFPEAVIRESAFGKETVDVGIPFEWPAKGVEDTGKTGDKVFGFIQRMEQPEDDAADSLEKAVKQGTVHQKERAQVCINGKNEVPVCAVNELEGHFSRAVNAVFIAAGGAELRMVAKRDKFKFTTVRTAIHGAAIRGIPAAYHFFQCFP